MEQFCFLWCTNTCSHPVFGLWHLMVSPSFIYCYKKIFDFIGYSSFWAPQAFIMLNGFMTMFKFSSPLFTVKKAEESFKVLSQFLYVCWDSTFQKKVLYNSSNFNLSIFQKIQYFELLNCHKQVTKCTSLKLHKKP